jgi:hypothetical protein
MIDAKKIIKTLAEAEQAHFEVHDNEYEILLMLYWEPDPKGEGKEIAKAKLPAKDAKRLSIAYFNQWMAELLLLWSKNKLKLDATYNWHDSTNPTSLLTGRKEESDYPTLKETYKICDIDVLIYSRRRFKDSAELKYWMDDFKVDYARKIRSHILPHKPDWNIWTCMLDISHGSPDETIPVLIPKKLANKKR